LPLEPGPCEMKSNVQHTVQTTEQALALLQGHLDGLSVRLKSFKQNGSLPARASNGGMRKQNSNSKPPVPFPMLSVIALFTLIALTVYCLKLLHGNLNPPLELSVRKVEL